MKVVEECAPIACPLGEGAFHHQSGMLSVRDLMLLYWDRFSIYADIILSTTFFEINNYLKYIDKLLFVYSKASRSMVSLDAKYG